VTAINDPRNGPLAGGRRITTATPVVVEVEPLFVTREDAARILCLSVVELDKLNWVNDNRFGAPSGCSV
jgi:hypothetical protein